MKRVYTINQKEAEDILKNEIQDFVITDYCKQNTCPYMTECRLEGTECIFVQAIDKTIERINKQTRKITELNKLKEK